MAASKLPMEVVVEEILPRLPAKSLLRFKCVCKFFRTLISSPEFVKHHLDLSLSSDTDRLLILAGKNGGVYSFHLDSPEFPTVRFSFPLDDPFIIGSCNGLVCIGTSLPALFIFNPSSGFFREINVNLLDSKTEYGFGFDKVNDDYKVVSITSHLGYDFDDAYETLRTVEVYSLKLGSWSLIEITSTQDSIVHMENGVLIDDHLVHWRFWHLLTGGFRVGYFDLRNNRWGDVPLPTDGDEFNNELVQLAYVEVLDGCLCLLTTNHGSSGDDLWVMKEYGVVESWVKLVRISHADFRPQAEISPLGYAKGLRSEILMFRKKRSKVFWYNIRDKTWRLAEIHGDRAYSEACLCKGSLVDIPGGVRFPVECEESLRPGMDASIVTV